MSSLLTLAVSVAWALVGLGVLLLLYWLLGRVQHWLQRRLERWLLHRRGALAQYLAQLQYLINGFLRLLFLALDLVLAAFYLTFVLRQFDFSHALGVHFTHWLKLWSGHIAYQVLIAIPNLLVAMLIFVTARGLVHANSTLLQRVERRQLRLPWISSDLAAPTRQISALLIWLFALALAYPYLPGSSSATFQGVSVLAGLMISLGGQSVVGQALAGFSLLYSHAVRPGEYVVIGSTRGTVIKIGMFATRIRTGTGEEVSIPNSVVFSQPIRNFSREGAGAQHVLQVSVSIGYGTPWRQVHALLLTAAQRCPGFLNEPAPYVLQQALSDFYVEYTLVAGFDITVLGSHALTLSALHGEVLDIFNENGVQIMSPHYVDDAASPQQVAPNDPWGPAQPQAPLSAALSLSPSARSDARGIS
ncbi:mechanosensitive ion channel family protein [Acidithiobacillus sp. AMEEHan]|uniref:mechanosensitive ion channel family protein n=1 Tax=Acidithiobacillus sp. AMEEHan TaxID=2994951 RepID=UPI0027E4FC12|nr:mechanosensitive ion channel family protein [Acidithiobacillus sp. AMEEHan]